MLILKKYTQSNYRSSLNVMILFIFNRNVWSSIASRSSGTDVVIGAVIV